MSEVNFPGFLEGIDMGKLSERTAIQRWKGGGRGREGRGAMSSKKELFSIELPLVNIIH